MEMGILRAKIREKLGIQSHSTFFGLFGGKKIALCLEKGDVQRLKNFFVYNLWSWNILYLGGDAIILLSVLEWLASN